MNGNDGGGCDFIFAFKNEYKWFVIRRKLLRGDIMPDTVSLQFISSLNFKEKIDTKNTFKICVVETKPGYNNYIGDNDALLIEDFLNHKKGETNKEIIDNQIKIVEKFLITPRHFDACINRSRDCRGGSDISVDQYEITEITGEKNKENTAHLRVCLYKSLSQSEINYFVYCPQIIIKKI